MGHTSGLGKGFLMIALVVLVILAVLAGVSFGIGALFGNPYISTILAAIIPTLIAYLLYQTRSTCLIIGGCGAGSGIVASLVASSIVGGLGVFLGMIAGAVVFVVALFVVLANVRSNKEEKSWRK